MPLRKSLAFRTRHQSTLYILLLCPMFCIANALQIKFFSIVAISILRIVTNLGPGLKSREALLEAIIVLVKI